MGKEWETKLKDIYGEEEDEQPIPWNQLEQNIPYKIVCCNDSRHNNFSNRKNGGTICNICLGSTYVLLKRII